MKIIQDFKSCVNYIEKVCNQSSDWVIMISLDGTIVGMDQNNDDVFGRILKYLHNPHTDNYDRINSNILSKPDKIYILQEYGMVRVSTIFSNLMTMYCPVYTECSDMSRAMVSLALDINCIKMPHKIVNKNNSRIVTEFINVIKEYSETQSLDYRLVCVRDLDIPASTVISVFVQHECDFVIINLWIPHKLNFYLKPRNSMDLEYSNDINIKSICTHDITGYPAMTYRGMQEIINDSKTIDLTGKEWMINPYDKSVINISGYGNLVLDEFIDPEELQYFIDLIYDGNTPDSSSLLYLKLEVSGLAVFRQSDYAVELIAQSPASPMQEMMIDVLLSCVCCSRPVISIWTDTLYKHASKNNAVYEVEVSESSPYNSTKCLYWRYSYLPLNQQQLISSVIGNFHEYLYLQVETGESYSHIQLISAEVLSG